MSEQGIGTARRNSWYGRFQRLIDGSLTFERFDAMLARAKAKNARKA